MNGVANAATFRFLTYHAKARFGFGTVDDVRHGWTLDPTSGVECRYPYVMIRIGFTAVIDLSQYAGGILQIEHRIAEHFPISVAWMRVIGVFNAYCPIVLQRIFNLRRDLFVRQWGKERKLPLCDEISYIGHHGLYTRLAVCR